MIWIAILITIFDFDYCFGFEMGRHCFYVNCNSSYHACSHVSFFNLPCDERRDMWILHCGGVSFQTNIENVNHVYICEKHFRSEDIAYRGCKSSLAAGAIPLPYDSSFCRCSE